MALPTCSVRARREHHQLLRRIGRALAAQPDLSESLDALIAGVTPDVTRPYTSADQRFEDIERRLERLEATAVLRSETHNVLPQRDTGDTRDTIPQHAAPTVTRQPPRTAAGQIRRRQPRPWTESDDAELRRIFDQGRTQADACREMDRPNSVISGKWGRLIEEKIARAEAAALPIELVRQIAAMMDAGKSAAEIMETMGLPLISAEEIKQRLLDEIMRAEPTGHVDEKPEPPTA
jgi:hypothetical protein